MMHELNFSSVSGFNTSVKYLQSANILNKYLAIGCNFSDIIYALGSKVVNEQIPYLLKVFLVEKLQYKFLSFNLKKEVTDFSYLRRKLMKYNQVNSNIIYYDTILGYKSLNPQSTQGWDNLVMSNGSLVVVYVIASGSIQPFLKQYLKDVQKIFNGAKDLEDEQSFIGATSIIKKLEAAKATMVPKPKKPVVSPHPTEDSKQEAEKEQNKETTASTPNTDANNKAKSDSDRSKNLKMTPKYSIQVTNELFHNGNVEAWKNIIESYNITYPSVELLVFHQGVKIVNLNSLFKWGKVKNGDIILFCLIGEKFQSIAKLQRYLFEGASNRFSRYLKKDINNPLKLF